MLQNCCCKSKQASRQDLRNEVLLNNSILSCCLRYRDIVMSFWKGIIWVNSFKDCLWGLWDRPELFAWLRQGAVRCCWFLSMLQVSVIMPITGEGEWQALYNLFLNKLAQKTFESWWCVFAVCCVGFLFPLCRSVVLQNFKGKQLTCFPFNSLSTFVKPE